MFESLRLVQTLYIWVQYTSREQNTSFSFETYPSIIESLVSDVGLSQNLVKTLSFYCVDCQIILMKRYVIQCDNVSYILQVLIAWQWLIKTCSAISFIVAVIVNWQIIFLQISCIKIWVLLVDSHTFEFVVIHIKEKCK